MFIFNKVLMCVFFVRKRKDVVLLTQKNADLCIFAKKVTTVFGSFSAEKDKVNVKYLNLRS